jgi:hypothetical protein
MVIPGFPTLADDGSNTIIRLFYLKYTIMKIQELMRAPTIRSVTTKSGSIDPRKAQRLQDPHGYFRNAKSAFLPKRNK